MSKNDNERIDPLDFTDALREELECMLLWLSADDLVNADEIRTTAVERKDEEPYVSMNPLNGDDHELVAQLNGIIGRSELLPPSPRAELKTPELIELRDLAEKGTGNARSRYHRALLEAAFPGLIRKAADTGAVPVFKALHDRKPTALCLSGGGIRSATFALGVIQGLAKAGMMTSFDYLSTVSGGGYMGSWLSAWINRDGNAQKVFSNLTAATEKPELRHLREYSNFLAPRLGLLSADSWTLIATYLRNLLINWLVYLPFLGAILLLPRLLVAAIGVGMPAGWTFAVSSLILVISVCVFGVCRPKVTTGLKGGARIALPASRMLLFALTPLLVSAIGFTISWSAVCCRDIPVWGFVILGLMVHVIGTVPYIFALQESRVWALLAAAVSGAFGGAILYAFTRIPVINEPLRFPEFYATFAPALFVTAFLLGAIHLTLFSAGKTLASEEDREYWARSGAWVMLGGFGLLVVSAISIYGPVLLALSPKFISALGGVGGLVTILLARSNATKGETTGRRTTTKSDLTLAIAAPLFVLVLLSAMSLGTTELLKAGWPGESPRAETSPLQTPRLELAATIDGRALDLRVGETPPPLALPRSAMDHLVIVRSSSPLQILGWLALALVLAAVAGFLVDVNKYSMHGLYKSRLVRAFLGASNKNRKTHPFTEFDPRDNLQMACLSQRPFHVINLALNLVKGDKLAWQQRKASSFTVSPLHCGSLNLGYRRAAEYGGDEGISLGAAVTISGAAVSPNMGYHSSPAISFLLALFNVRLGAWLGNPGPAGGQMPKWSGIFPGEPAYRKHSPRFSLLHQLAEMFGWTDSSHQYVYLSDGGHSDNLGLYEMVLRRCHHIVVVDAGCDPHLTFDDLGNAIRKIRIDLGIPITFKEFKLKARGEKHGARCAVGEIDYGAVDGLGTEPGTILYIKPGYCGSNRETLDVRNYAASSEAFPHETTGDQFFSESQFESYRILGQTIVEQIVAGRNFNTLHDLCEGCTNLEGRIAPEDMKFC